MLCSVLGFHKRIPPSLLEIYKNKEEDNSIAREITKYPYKFRKAEKIFMNLKCGIKDIVIRKRIILNSPLLLFHLKGFEPRDMLCSVVRQGASK